MTATRSSPTGDEGEAALERAGEELAGEGLSLPWIPDRLRPAVRRIGPLHYAAGLLREGVGPLELVRRFTGGRALGDSFLLLSLGRGLHNRELRYHLILPGLCVFVDTPFGGLDDRSPQAAREVAERWARARALIERHEQCRQASRLAPDEGFFVHSPAFEPGTWGHRAARDTRPAVAWHDAADPLAELLAHLDR